MKRLSLQFTKDDSSILHTFCDKDSVLDYLQETCGTAIRGTDFHKLYFSNKFATTSTSVLLSLHLLLQNIGKFGLGLVLVGSGRPRSLVFVWRTFYRLREHSNWNNPR